MGVGASMTYYETWEVNGQTIRVTLEQRKKMKLLSKSNAWLVRAVYE